MCLSNTNSPLPHQKRMLENILLASPNICVTSWVVPQTRNDLVLLSLCHEKQIKGIVEQIDKILSASIYSAKHFAHFCLHTSLLPLLPQLHLTKSLADRPEQDRNNNFFIKVMVAISFGQRCSHKVFFSNDDVDGWKQSRDTCPSSFFFLMAHWKW